MARRDPRFPPINAVAAELRRRAGHIEWACGRGEEDDFCDVRLQIYHHPENPRVMAWWSVHIGPSDYDTDHRGFWGVGCIPRGPFNSRALAANLIEQTREAAAQREEFHKAIRGIAQEGAHDQ